MNRVHKTLWSESAQCWQAVPETAKAAGKRSVKSASGGVLATVVMGLALSGGAGAQSPPPPASTQLPTGGSVSRGSATIAQTATAQAAAMTVNQSSQRAIINWDSFNLGTAASINFVQPNAQAVTLNRVNDHNPSQIFGRITSNGQVFLSNPSGVYFSPTASVDVGALVATSHSISDANFMAGNYLFERNGATGKVINEGRINAALGGYVALLAPEVQNAGVVLARAGTVALAAGEVISLQVQGGGLAGITTTPSTIATLIENKLAVQAPDGQIILSAVALNKLQAGVIKNSGSLEANSLVAKGGKIYLEADDITLAATSRIEAKGPTGGGTVLVGGDWQGTGDLRQATKVTMEAGASIDASATDQGDGGKVVLWSNIHQDGGFTRVNGRIQAEAGPNGGDGGQIETSGHGLEVGEAVISAQSFKGKDGLWLLDPYNITISSSANASTTNASNTFTSSASGGVVNATALQSALSTNDVTVSTTGAGTDAGNITLSNSLTWSSNKTLTLSAQGVVTGSGGVAMTGGGALVIQQEGNSTSSSNPYSGIISGTGSFTKDGAGNLYFSGTSTNSTTVNSYTGNTTIRAGTLILGTVTPWGAGGTVTVANGATLDLNGKAVTSTNALVLNGSFSQYVGALSNSGASIGRYAGPITLGSASTIGGSNVINLTSTNPITGAYDLTLAGNSSVVSTITGDIATGTGGLIVNGSIPSTLWRINGNNSYTGNTLISKGKLRLGSPTPWVSGGTVTVSNGSTLDLNGQTVTSTNALTLNGFFFSTEGALSNSSTTTTASYAGPITLGSTSTIGSYGGIELTHSSGITGNNYGLTLNMSAIAMASKIAGPIALGAGGVTFGGSNAASSWTFNGNNSYTGSTYLNKGILILGTANPWGTGGTVNVSNGSTLDLNGQTVVPTNAMTLAGTLTNSSTTPASYGGLISLGADSSIVGDAGTISLTNAGTISGAFGLTLGGAQGGTLASILGTTTGTLTKTGAGTWTLGGLNTFTGNATISAGLLKLGTTTPWGGTGTVSVASGAALDLNGQTVVSGSGRGLTLNGTGINASGALFNSSSTAASYGGLISLGSASSILGDAGTISLSNAGTISGAYGLTFGGAQGGTLASILGTTIGSLTKEGAGTWTLGGVNTFTSNATISAGLLKLGSTTPWGGTGTVSVASGAALDLNGQTVVAGSNRALTLNGTGINASGALFNSSSTAASYGGLVSLGSATTIMGDTGSINLSSTGTTTTTHALTLGGAQGGTFASVLGTATGTLTKTGLGTWRLSGSNTYTGATTISAGTLQLIGTGGIASSAGVANSGTLDISGTTNGATIKVLTGTGGVTLGSKFLTLNGTSTFDGVISGTGGLNVAEFGAITLTADQTFTGTTTMVGNIIGSSLTLGNGGTGGRLAGAISMANSGSSLTVNRSNDLTLSGVITGLGSLNKNGTGALTLSGTNSTFNGAVKINAGTLKLGSSTPWGLTALQSVTVSAGAALDLNGFSLSTSRPMTLNGTGINGGGAMLNSSTGATYSGLITLGSATSIVGDTGSINLSNIGTISGATFGLTLGGGQGGTLASVLGTTTGTLTKTGLGTWTLTGANTYTGSTTINAGTLQVGTLASTTAKLGTGAVINNANLVFVRNGGFQLSAMAPNAGAITGTGNVTVQGNGTVNIDRAITLTGANSVIKVLAGAASGANTSLVSDLTLTSTLTTSATGTVAIFAGSPTATVANGSTANLGLKMAGATGGIQYKTYNASSASLANAVAGTRNFYYRVLPSLSVTGATVSATKTYDGTTAAAQVTVTGGSSTGSIDGDLMGFSATSANYASASAGTGIGLTVDLAARSSNNLWVVSGYSGSLTGGTVSGTINKAPLVVKANDDARFVTQTDTVGYSGVSYSGWVNNETSAVLGGSLALARSSPGATAAGSYTLTPSGLTAANYDISYRTGSYTIVPANQLLVRVADASSVYGNAPSYSITSAKYVMPDNSLVDLTGNLSLSGGTYTLNDGASGNAQFALGLSSPTLSSAGKPSVGIWNVAASGATTTSPNFSNTLTVIGTQTITPRSLMVSATANQKVYDGDMGATVTLGDNRVVGDVLLTAQTGASFASKNAANGVTVTVNGITASGTDMANYTLANTSTTTTANITPKPLGLAGLSAANKVYDGTTSVVMNSYGTLSGAVGIDDVQVDATGVSAAFATKAAGNGKTVNISGLIVGGADMGNYSLANPFTTTANITPKALSVSGLGAAASKVYDGNTSATLTGSASLAAASAPGAGNNTDGLPYTGDALVVAGTPTGTYNSKDVASAASISVAGLSLSGADASNYSLDSHTPIAATINPKSLIVKANNDANFFALADTPGFNGVSYVGFVQNESASNLSFANGTGPVITSNLTTGVGGQRSTPGTYVGALTPSGVNAGNYTPSYQTGDFTVVPADRLMVRVSNLSVPYGSSSPYGTPSASYYSSTFGLVPGLTVTPSGNAYVITDPANGVSAKVTLAPVTTAAQLSQSGNAAVGTYNIDAASVTNVVGGASFNVVAVTGTQTVTQKALTLTATAANKTYDGSASASVTLASGDALTGDALIYNKVAATFADKNAGSAKTVSVTGLSLGDADAGNYILQNISAQTQADIARKQVQLAGTKTYDGGTSLSASQLSVTTGVGTETLSFSAASIGSKNVADNASNRVTSLTLTDGSNGGLASNYTYTTVRGADNAVAINPASLTIAPVTAAKTYDGTQSSAVAVTISNNSGSADVVAAVQEFSSPNSMGAGGSSLQIKAGYTVVDSLNADMRGNYNITANGTATGTINKAPLTVTANNASKTYGDANPALSTTVSGFVNGESLATSGVAGAGAASTTATTTTGAGTATITAGVGSLTAANYDFSNLVNGTLTINKAPLTVTANNASKTYGDANPALSTTVSGFVNGETLATSGVAGAGAASTTATTTTGAGTATITAGVGSLTAANYDFSNLVNGTLTINKAPLTVTANNASKTYGDANPALSTTVSGFVNGESLATSGVAGAGAASTTATTTTGAGTATITAGVGSLTAANYDFSNLVNGTLTINKAPLTVTANNASKTYGDANPALSTTVSGFVNGETLATSGVAGAGAASTTATTTTGAGTATITAGVGSLTAANYDFSNLVNGTLTINKAPLTVTANNASKTYGDDNPSLSTTVSGFVNGESLATSGVAGAGAASTTATTTTGAGTATITAGVGSLTAANYDFSNLVNGTLTINKAPLTVTANNASKTYGDANPTLSTTVSGFVNGETLATSGVAGAGAASTTATTTTGAGTATITAGVGSLTAANYDFSNLVNGTLTINKAPLTVTANNASKTYGDANPTLSTTVSGFVNGETLATSGVAGTGAATTTATTATGAGTATITAGMGSLTASNYDFSNWVNGTLTINKAPLTVTANNASKTYGDANPALSTTVSGFVNGESLATSGVAGAGAASTTATTTTGAGTATITAGVGSLTAANYDFSNLVNGTLTINKAPLTVTANNASKTYGDDNPSLSTTVSGFVNGETLSTSGVAGLGNATTTATNTTAAGTATITAGVGTLTASNYDFSNWVNGTLTINKAPLTVTANNASKTYGDANPTLSTTVSGFVNGETLATSGVAGAGAASTTATTTTGAGTATITAGVGSLTAANYDFSNLVNGTLTINKAPLTVTANNASKTYGDANPTLSTTVSGFVNGETLATSGVAGTGAATTTATTATGAGTATITAGMGSLTAANYDFSNLVNGTLTINKAPLTVTANNASKTYGDANPTLSTTVSGFVNGETLATSGVAGTGAATTTATTATGAGTATITAGMGSLTAANYDFSNLVNGTLTIQAGKTPANDSQAVLVVKKVVQEVAQLATPVINIPVVSVTTTPPSVLTVPVPPGPAPDISIAPQTLAVSELSTPQRPVVDALPVPPTAPAPVVAALLPGNPSSNADNPDDKDRPTISAALRPTATPILQGEQVAYLRPAEVSAPAASLATTVRAEPLAPPASAPTLASALPQPNASAAPVAAAAPASVQAASASTEAPRSAPTVASVNAPAAAPTGTGVLAITILRSNNAQPSTAGVAFEQNADTLSLRATDAPLLPPSSERLVFSDRLTTFLVANSAGTMVEFQGSLVNNRMVIVAPSNAARLVAQTDMSTVLAAAVTSLGRESRVMLAQLDGVVLDLR